MLSGLSGEPVAGVHLLARGLPRLGSWQFQRMQLGRVGQRSQAKASASMSDN